MHISIESTAALPPEAWDTHEVGEALIDPKNFGLEEDTTSSHASWRGELPQTNSQLIPESAAWVNKMRSSAIWDSSAAPVREWTQVGQDWMAADLPISEPPDPDTRASRRGFPTAVLPSHHERIMVYRGQPDAQLSCGCDHRIKIRQDAFARSDAQAQVHLRLLQSNGQPLPSWLKFDGISGQLLVQAPSGTRSDLTMRLTATDMQGAEVSTFFRLQIRDDTSQDWGRASLTEKLHRTSQGTRSAEFGLGAMFKNG